MRFFWILGSIAATLAAVIEVDDNSVDKILSKDIPTILSIYAPWCGHCKTFHPEFDDLAKQYEHAKDKIQFVRLDGDANRKSAEKFGVKYFPTLKFVKGKKHEEISDRKIDNLKALIKKKTGAEPKAESKSAQVDDKRNFVVELTDANFDAKTNGKHALVAFTTDWCGHCKKLKPVWQKAAYLYATDKDILIANVDCTSDQGTRLAKEAGVKGYPTLVYYPKDGSDPVPYSGDRSLKGITGFLTDLGASFRKESGFLNSKAGLIEEFAEDSKKLINSNKEFADAFLEKAKASTEATAKKYARLIPRIHEGGEKFIKSERKRMRKLLKGHISSQLRDDIKIKLNILNSFLHKNEKDAEDSASAEKDEL